MARIALVIGLSLVVGCSEDDTGVAGAIDTTGAGATDAKGGTDAAGETAPGARGLQRRRLRGGLRRCGLCGDELRVEHLREGASVRR